MEEDAPPNQRPPTPPASAGDDDNEAAPRGSSPANDLGVVASPPTPHFDAEPSSNAVDCGAEASVVARGGPGGSADVVAAEASTSDFFSAGVDGSRSAVASGDTPAFADSVEPYANCFDGDSLSSSRYESRDIVDRRMPDEEGGGASLVGVADGGVDSVGDVSGGNCAGADGVVEIDECTVTNGVVKDDKFAIMSGVVKIDESTSGPHDFILDENVDTLVGSGNFDPSSAVYEASQDQASQIANSVAGVIPVCDIGNEVERASSVLFVKAEGIENVASVPSSNDKGSGHSPHNAGDTVALPATKVAAVDEDSRSGSHFADVLPEDVIGRENVTDISVQSDDAIKMETNVVENLAEDIFLEVCEQTGDGMDIAAPSAGVQLSKDSGVVSTEIGGLVEMAHQIDEMSSCLTGEAAIAASHRDLAATSDHIVDEEMDARLDIEGAEAAGNGDLVMKDGHSVEKYVTDEGGDMMDVKAISGDNTDTAYKGATKMDVIFASMEGNVEADEVLVGDAVEDALKGDHMIAEMAVEAGVSGCATQVDGGSASGDQKVDVEEVMVGKDVDDTQNDNDLIKKIVEVDEYEGATQVDGSFTSRKGNAEQEEVMVGDAVADTQKVDDDIEQKAVEAGASERETEIDEGFESGERNGVNEEVMVSDAEMGTIKDEIIERSVPMDNDDTDDDKDDEPPPLTGKKGGGRRKRGRPPKVQPPKAIAKKKDTEEVCFICFDGGNLVACDRRGCPKVYHPSCVNRDDAFFRTKGRWNCGWHICSNCQRQAGYMCYTCTFSLCKDCVQGAVFLCVRGKMGFCQTCLNTVMLFEDKEHDHKQMDGIDFDDKNSWWYMFKDYWLSLKEHFSLTLEELSAAKSRQNVPSVATHDKNLDDFSDDNAAGQDASSDSSSHHHETTRKHTRKRLRRGAVNEDALSGKESRQASVERKLGHRDGQSSSQKKGRKHARQSATSSKHLTRETESVATSIPEAASWASKELLDFVAHVRSGDTSELSQYDVQELLLKYVTQHKLRDPRRKSQIVCDPLLENLFGKPRVGHFEMLKLLESHFIQSENAPVDTDDNQGGVVDPDPHPVFVDGQSEASIVTSSDKRKKHRKNFEKDTSNLDDYAAIDVHNISLMYLRRSLLEELTENSDSFSEKVVGAFVRIRISGSGLQRQDLYRLVQVVGIGKTSEKYKFGKALTDVMLDIVNLDKKELISADTVSNQEFTEEECRRLRQSIKCGFIPRLTVGEVQEKARALHALKVNDWIENEKQRLAHLRDRASDMGRRKELRECVEKLQLLATPEEHARRLNEEPEIHADPTMDPDYESTEEEEEKVDKKDNYGKPRDSFFNKGSSGISPKSGGVATNSWKSSHRTARDELNPPRESSAAVGRNPHQSNKLETSKMEVSSSQYGPSWSSSDNPRATVAAAAAAPSTGMNESEKIWHYMDPSGKIQGPFSMAQLRKWNSTGYFPANLKIWSTSGKQEESVLLTDALLGKFPSQSTWHEPQSNNPYSSRSMVRSNSDISTRPNDRSSMIKDARTGGGEHRWTGDRGNSRHNNSTPEAMNRSQSFQDRSGRGGDERQRSYGSGVQSREHGYGNQASQMLYANQQASSGKPRVEAHVASNQLAANSNPQAYIQQTGPAGHSAAQDAMLVAAANPNPNLIPLVTQPTAVQLNAQQLGEGLKQILGESSIGQTLAEQVLNLADKQKPQENVADMTNSSAVNQLVVSQTATSAPSSVTDNSQSNQLVAAENAFSAPSTQPMEAPVQFQQQLDTNNAGWQMAQQMLGTPGQVAGSGGVNWGMATLQGNTNMGWGMMGQPVNMNMAWANPAQAMANFNMAFVPQQQQQQQQQANPVQNMGWVAPNQANTNPSVAVATAVQGQGNPNTALLGAQMQAAAAWGMVPQGNPNSYPGWVAPGMGTVNQNVNWSAPVQGNMDQTNVSSTGNPTGWVGQPGDNNSGGGANSGQGNGSRGRPGFRSRWDPVQPGSNGGSSTPRQQGICQFYENGHCKKGSQCNYYHPPRNSER